jgi:hypothetical protein
MPIKRQPSDAELDALAARLRILWREGDVIRPWLRKHHDMIRDLVHEDWSWASLAVALTRAGISWRTGRAWSAEGLRREIVRATIPLKSRSKASADSNSVHPSPAPTGRPAAHEVPNSAVQIAATRSTLASAATAPRFKPASLRPHEAPRAPTPEEEREREVVRKGIFG